jgi:hypothetical protein
MGSRKGDCLPHRISGPIASAPFRRQFRQISSLLCVAVSASASHLIIAPIFDSTITSDPNASAIESTIRASIASYAVAFADPITISISFQRTSAGLGVSESSLQKVPYSNFYSALVADARTTNDAVVLAHLPNGGAKQSTNPVTGSTTINLNLATIKALKIPGSFPSGLSCGCDGIVSINTSLTAPGSPGSSGAYSLDAVVKHEIDEVLGLGSDLSQIAAGAGSFFNDPLPEDLFRYNAKGSRSFTTSGSETAYFSLDANTRLAQFDNQNDGGDFGDWQSNPLPLGVQAQVQDAFRSPGIDPSLGTELTALDAIGYDLIPSTKVGIFRSSAFMLAMDVNGNLTWDPGTDRAAFFGSSGDTLIFGDWDGSGATKMGIFRPTVGMFALDVNGNGMWDPGVDRFGFFGQNGDLPIVGDWTGDGKSKIGIYRPTTGLFALDLNNNLSWDVGTDQAGRFGQPGDIPLVGNWTGDGKYKVGVFRDGLWELDTNGNLTFDAGADASGTIGQTGDTPLVGDWNGDGRTKVGIYRPSESMFGLDYNGNLAWDAGIDRAAVFGIPTDTPIVGDWDGTGVTRIGIYRGTSAFWALDMNGNIQWDAGTDRWGGFGASGDTPAVGRWQ